MACSNLSSAHPRESGDPGVFRCGGRAGDGGRAGRSEAQKAWVPAFAGMSGVLGLLAPGAAFAHEGHHEHMSVAQALEHLQTQPDHQLAFAGLVVALVTGGWAWVLATERK